MRLKVKIMHLYEEASGVSQRTGMSYRNRDVRLRVIREDGSESGEEFFAKINNAILLDAPAIHEGAVGFAGIFWMADESSFNGRQYRNTRCTLNGFTPQEDVKEEPSAAPCEQAAVPAPLAEGEAPVKLPF